MVGARRPHVPMCWERGSRRGAIGGSSKLGPLRAGLRAARGPAVFRRASLASTRTSGARWDNRRDRSTGCDADLCRYRFLSLLRLQICSAFTLSVAKLPAAPQICRATPCPRACCAHAAHNGQSGLSSVGRGRRAAGVYVRASHGAGSPTHRSCSPRLPETAPPPDS